MYQSQFNVPQDQASHLAALDWTQPQKNDVASIGLMQNLVQLSDPVQYSRIQAQVAPPLVHAPPSQKLSKLQVVQAKQQIEQQLAKLVAVIRNKGLAEAEVPLREQLASLQQIMMSLE